MNQNELYHYGVLGMKWGVRRYRNSGGSYTREGLKRFDKSYEDYQSKNNAYKDARKTKDKLAIRKAKNERKISKRNLNRDYKQLARDKAGDKGKALYQSGKTITGNMSRNLIAQTAIVAGSSISSKVLRSSGNQTLASIVPSVIAIGGTAVNAIIAAKTYSDNKNLRAYYGHSRPKS